MFNSQPVQQQKTIFNQFINQPRLFQSYKTEEDNQLEEDRQNNKKTYDKYMERAYQEHQNQEKQINQMRQSLQNATQMLNQKDWEIYQLNQKINQKSQENKQVEIKIKNQYLDRLKLQQKQLEKIFYQKTQELRNKSIEYFKNHKIDSYQVDGILTDAAMIYIYQKVWSNKVKDINDKCQQIQNKYKNIIQEFEQSESDDDNSFNDIQLDQNNNKSNEQILSDIQINQQHAQQQFQQQNQQSQQDTQQLQQNVNQSSQQTTQQHQQQSITQPQQIKQFKPQIQQLHQLTLSRQLPEIPEQDLPHTQDLQANTQQPNTIYNVDAKQITHHITQNKWLNADICQQLQSIEFYRYIRKLENEHQIQSELLDYVVDYITDTEMQNKYSFDKRSENKEVNQMPQWQFNNKIGSFTGSINNSNINGNISNQSNLNEIDKVDNDSNSVRDVQNITSVNEIQSAQDIDSTYSAQGIQGIQGVQSVQRVYDIQGIQGNQRGQQYKQDVQGGQSTQGTTGSQDMQSIYGVFDKTSDLNKVDQ